MKVRHTTENVKIALQMTPMIDIVFQLLIFFIMTFKIVALEGDFNIKMPSAAPSEGAPDEDQLPPIVLKLSADAAGNLTSIMLNDQPLESFSELHSYIIDLVGQDAGPDTGLAGAEVEIDCDPNLKYVNTVEAMTAVTGKVAEDGTIIKLIEKVKFTPPRLGR